MGRGGLAFGPRGNPGIPFWKGLLKWTPCPGCCLAQNSNLALGHDREFRVRGVGRGMGNPNSVVKMMARSQKWSEQNQRTSASVEQILASSFRKKAKTSLLWVMPLIFNYNRFPSHLLARQAQILCMPRFDRFKAMIQSYILYLLYCILLYCNLNYFCIRYFVTSFWYKNFRIKDLLYKCWLQVYPNRRSQNIRNRRDAVRNANI